MHRPSLTALAAALVLIAAAGGPSPAAAEPAASTWPSRSIRAIIPFGAGSATDVVPRIVFEQLSQRLGQTIVVENRVGAGGSLGTNMVAKADPDGYTLLAHSSAHTITPAMYPNLPYDTEKDLIPVAYIGASPSVLIISPSKGVTDIKQFVAAAKAKTNAFSFASVGVGSAVHIAAERFRLAAGYEAVHVPFRSGSDGIAAVLSGQVEYYFCPIATASPFIKDGKLLGLTVSAPERSAALPDVPTTIEAGYPDSDTNNWIGIFVPAKTPQATMDRIHAEVDTVLAMPSVKDRLAVIGVDLKKTSQAQFQALVKEDIAKFGAFARKANLKGS